MYSNLFLCHNLFSKNTRRKERRHKHHSFTFHRPCGGWGCGEKVLAAWGPFLASYGIVAMTIGTPKPWSDTPPTRAQALIDASMALQKENTRSNSPLYNHLDENSRAVMGYSLGGGGAQLAALLDPTLKRCVAICPHDGNDFGNVFPEHLSKNVPILILAGEKDKEADPKTQAWEHYRKTTAPTLIMEVKNGDHYTGIGPSGGNGSDVENGDVPSHYEWFVTPKNFYSDKEWVTSASIQTASASVSMIASTVMFISIIRHHKEELKTSPYFRLILSLAFADMIYSFSFIIGPFVVPKSYKLMGLWALGNDATCAITAAIHTFGLILSALNYAFICFYHVMKLKAKMSDSLFALKFEKKLFAFMYLFPIGIFVSSFFMHIVGVDSEGLICTCGVLKSSMCVEQGENVICTYDSRGTENLGYYWIFANGVGALTMLFIVFSMVALGWHVIRQNRIYRSLSQAQENSNDVQNHTTNDRQIIAESLRIMFLRQSLMQGFLYSAVILVSYVPVIVYTVAILNDRNDETAIVYSNRVKFLLVCKSLLQPLSGFFNILVYTRIDVYNLRLRKNYSRVRAFFEILISGGKILPKKENKRPLSIASVPFGIVPESAFSSLGGNNLGNFEDLNKDNVRYCNQNKWDYYVSRKQQSVIVFVDEDEIDASNIHFFMSEESPEVIDTFHDEGISEETSKYHQYGDLAESSDDHLSHIPSNIEIGVSFQEHSL
ncbi:triacylglycerol lipase 1 [Chaetoceros tenuissimus]|uniref:Triacylglycerol lipase 1 n=1 Tax=Chaetoceros tenuissimus TaxID=426638 RepID=A0AAD3D1V0_9STRA|nr:triacylglycerol lipase 1 [Chaetoceros tenuissimus]